MKAEKEMIGGCCVCGEEQADQNNVLVYCDGPSHCDGPENGPGNDGTGCQVAVHQNCYGVTKIPKGDWFCTPCRHSIKSPKCELCPSSTGAFKRTTSKQWAHVICALYFPNISFVNNVLMEPIELEGLHPDVFEKICMLCKNEEDASYGACVTCNYPNCKNSFHITCGQREGCLCEEIDGKKSSKKDSVKYASYTCYCLLHIKKILDISKISKEVVYKVLPKFNPPKPSTSSSKANSSLINKSSPINLSSSSTSSRDSSPTGSTMKKPDSDRLHISKVDRNSKPVSKDLRLSKKVSSSHKTPPCSQSNNGYMNGSNNTALTSATKFDNCSRSNSKGSKNSSSSSGFSSSSNNSVTSKLSKIDKTLTISESGSKHRIGSPSATMANQPPRKRTHSSSSSSGKSSSSSSDSDSGSESSSSDSSSSSKSSSKKAHHSSSSSSSSDSSNSSSSSESDDEKGHKNKCHVNAESSPVSKKALKKSRLVYTEPAATKQLSRQEQSKKMKLKHDSSSNNPSSESLSTFLTDKLKSSKRDRSSSTSMAPKKKVNVDKVKAKSSNSESSSNSLPKSVVSSAISTLITTSSSKQFSQLLLSEDSEPEEPLKSEKKSMKQSIPSNPKKSSSVLTSRSSKGAPRSVLSESSAESEADKSDSESSDDEKAKHRSDEDPFASKLTKKVFVKKSFSPEKKPRGSKTAASSSYKSKENFGVDEPTTKVTNKKSPTKKEPSENNGSKSKQSIKDMSDSAPATASRKRRNSPSKALKSTSNVLPHNGISTITKECESDCKSMSSSADRSRSKKVADSLSQVVSSPIDHHNGAIKAFPFSAIISPGASQSTSSNHNLPDNNLNIIIPASLSKTVMVQQHLASPPPPTVVAASAQPFQFPLHLERPPTPKSLEDLLEFQWINTSHFLLDQEENHDVAMLIQKLNSLVQENVQLERNLHTLNDSYSNLVSVNSRLKNLVMTDLSDQPSQITELAASNDTTTFGNLPATLSVVSVSSASKPLPGHGTMVPSLARPTVPPSTSLQHLSQSRYSASSTISPAVISSASLIPLLTTSAILSSAVTSSSSPSVYSSSSALPSNSSAQLPTANTSLTNLLATTNHFMNNHQAATSSPYLYNSHATASDILNDVAIASRDRQETAFATSTTDAASSNTMTSSLYSQFINGKSSTCAIPHSNLISQHSLSSTSNNDRQHASAAAPFLNQLMAVASSNAHAHPSHFMTSSGGTFESQDMSNIGRPAVIARNNGSVSVSEPSSHRHYGNLNHLPNGSANAQPSHFYSHH